MVLVGLVESLTRHLFAFDAVILFFFSHCTRAWNYESTPVRRYDTGIILPGKTYGGGKFKGLFELLFHVTLLTCGMH